MSETRPKGRNHFPGHYIGLHLSLSLSGAFLCWYPKHMLSLPLLDHEPNEEKGSSYSFPRQKVGRMSSCAQMNQLDRTKSLAIEPPGLDSDEFPEGSPQKVRLCDASGACVGSRGQSLRQVERRHSHPPELSWWDINEEGRETEDRQVPGSGFSQS